MERLDKVICNQLGYSRKEIKELVHNKRIMVNDSVVLKSDLKVDKYKDKIIVDSQIIEFKEYVYLMLNKPKGYISATEDRSMSTVLDLVPYEYLHRNLFPAGRLDKDTTGLMIITDDGNFAHDILSPKKHIKKEYMVTIDIPLDEEMVRGFESGIKLVDGDCKPSKLEIISEYVGKVTLVEGKYHQIKRMFGCFGAKVLELERISMGNFSLPGDLKLGECREFTKDELDLVRGLR